MAKHRSPSLRRSIALVGSDTLLGRDLKEVLGAEGRNEITDFAANAEGSFGSEEGEAVYLHPLDAASVESVDAVLSAGNDLGATKAFELVQATERYVPLIDCTGALDNRPEARIWPDTPQAASGKQRLFVVAHPAASVIAQILEGLTSLHPIQRSVVEVFEPASERGQKGISELQQQTASLLSFKKLDKAVFDTQLSFNLLAAYGEEAPVHLSTIEHRIEMHLATLLARKGVSTPIPMPSLRLIQAPVFHGYSLSFWVEFSARPEVETIADTLAERGLDVRKQGEEPPTNVGIAGQSGIAVGDIRADRNNPRAIWIWAAADNFRIVADSVTALLSQLEAPAA